MLYPRSSNLIAIPPTSRAALVHPAHRRLEAQAWRSVRRRLNALPFHIRAYVRVAWSRSSHRDPASLLRLVGHAAAELGAAPDDFPHLDESTRLRLSRELDLGALHQDPASNFKFWSAPALEAWLSATDHRQYAPAISLRAHAVRQAIGALGFAYAKTPRETPRSELEAAGIWISVELHRLRPGYRGLSATPWNADLCRRVVFIKHSADPTTLADLLPTEDYDR